MLLKVFTLFLAMDAVLILCINALDFFGYWPVYRTDIMIGGISTRYIGLVMFTVMAILILRVAYDVLGTKTGAKTE